MWRHGQATDAGSRHFGSPVWAKRTQYSIMASESCRSAAFILPLGTNQDSSSCAGRPCPWRAPIEEISHLFGGVVIPLLAPRADLPHDGAANVEACTDLVGNGREAVLDDALVRLLRLGGLSGPAGTVGGLPTSSGAKPRVCAQPDCKRLAADRASGSCSEALTQSCPPPKVRHAARVGAKLRRAARQDRRIAHQAAAQKRSPQNRRGNVTVHANAGVTLAATASDGPRYLPVAVELEPTGTTSAT